MNKIDTYILRQLVGPFFFFLLVFTGILWLNQALFIVDIVVENGQPASIFLELSALVLPKVLQSAIPIAAFSSAIFVTNKLYSEAELVVMMSSGRSFLHLAKPYFVFGLLAFIGMFSLMHWFGPWTAEASASRQDEIRRQFITQIIKPGEFITRDNKYTFFFGNKDTNGAVEDVLIEEVSSPTKSLTYFATKGQVVTESDSSKLVLFNGSIQNLDTSNNSLSLVKFDTLSFDLDQLAGDIPARRRSISELTTSELMSEINQMELGDAGFNRSVATLHSRHVKTLLTLLVPALALAVLLVGGYRRAGFMVRIIVGVLLMAAINSLRGTATTWVTKAPDKAFLLYTPVLLTLLLTLTLLWLASKDISGFFKRRRKLGVEGT